MKWKRGSFKIAVNPKVAAWMGDDCNRSGLVSGVWAINKTSTGFALTLLSGGLKVGDYDRMAHAKEVAAKLAAIPVKWDTASPLHCADRNTVAKVREIALRLHGA